MLIEVLDINSELAVIPPGQMLWTTFRACLPFIELVQPLMYPVNPYTGTVTPKEYA